VLLHLRDYLAKERCVSLEQLARVFKTDKTALLPMLEVWVVRGVLHVDEQTVTCAAACGGCSGEAPKYYRYVEYGDRSDMIAPGLLG